ncbi:helix-turn-helix domain-containing protein [Shewanella sp. AS1]|uniref:winged helix-turn-helix domain-containing protein n=1 Tax=Shewanella sp. AS1 TaxID=2907626 RepID=UPI001F223028|nr:helix-turn-helix domain-containing protein [Shewanella sp. AS1]MCE9677778.1 helix-turn-helix domain-containing protein [Shewanella sp. AS1]
MQLGDCLFDRQRGLLTNQVNGDEWHLPRAELQVLTLLLDNQNRVVPKQTLGACDAEHPALSDSSVTRAVFMLRSFLGPMHENMIETVKGKGYRLRLDRASAQSLHNRDSSLNRLNQYYQDAVTWLFGRRNRVLKAWVGVLVLCLCLLVAQQWLRSGQTESVRTEPFATETITLASGQKVALISFAKSRTNNTSLVELSRRLGEGLARCKVTPWQKVYLSLSHDKQVFNVTLRGERFGQSLVRNLKLTDFRQQKSFISEAWLTEVSLCE